MTHVLWIALAVVCGAGWLYAAGCLLAALGFAIASAVHDRRHPGRPDVCGGGRVVRVSDRQWARFLAAHGLPAPAESGSEGLS